MANHPLHQNDWRLPGGVILGGQCPVLGQLSPLATQFPELPYPGQMHHSQDFLVARISLNIAKCANDGAPSAPALLEAKVSLSDRCLMRPADITQLDQALLRWPHDWHGCRTKVRIGDVPANRVFGLCTKGISTSVVSRQVQSIVGRRMDIQRFERLVRDPRKTREDLENMKKNALAKGKPEFAAIANGFLCSGFL
jgi:hypothetical protein